jgi:hypothetical protein
MARKKASSGYEFEVELAKLAERFLGKYVRQNYRVFGSGRNKNAVFSGGDERRLGDHFLEVKTNKRFLFPWKIRFTTEAKWYSTKGTVKSVAIQKGWLDQCRHEAAEQGSFPIFAIKFKGQNKRSKELKKYNWYGRDANAVWFAMPAKHFFLLILFLLGARLGVDLRGQVKDVETSEAISPKAKRKGRSDKH